VSFFDQSLTQIGTAQQFLYTREATRDGLLEWHGWKSAVTVRRIVYSGDFVVNDGMRVNLVPEPNALILTLVGFAAAFALRLPFRTSFG
jgi:hypothetical protein